MAQLKIKQISDFVTGVQSEINALVGTSTATAISTAKSEAISAASADATSKANDAESNAVATASADATSKANAAKSEAISAASADATSKANDAESNANAYASDADVVVLNAAKAHSDIQKGRLDALLSDSDGALDTFVEIENFIKNLSTADINGLIQDIADAESDAIVSAKGYTDVEIAKLDTRLDGLEGVGFEEVIAGFIDVKTVRSSVKFDVTNVKVFVNGLQIHELGSMNEGWVTSNGVDFTLKLPYDLESTDHVVISGKLA